MADTEDATSRIRRSVRTLREWQWIATISTDPDTVLVNLRKEAKELIALGIDNPKRANEIGTVVVAYHRLIVMIKNAMGRTRDSGGKTAA